jgi:hypothetical protein
VRRISANASCVPDALRARPPRARWIRKRFRCVAVPAIIERVHCRRVVVAVAVLSVLSACTWGGDKKTAPALPINPTPTAPGQVVVLAGNGEQKNPVNGAYATRSPIYASGAIAAAPDGSIFTFADNGQHRVLVQIATNGRVRVLPIKAMRTDRQVLAATSTNLWWMSTAPGNSWLTRFSLDGMNEAVYFGSPQNNPQDLIFVDGRNRDLPAAEQRRLVKQWKPSAMAVRNDGTPVVATEDGNLYEARGDGKIRLWKPAGYAAAVAEVQGRGGSGKRGLDLAPSVMLLDGKGGLVVAGQGIVHIPERGEATATQLRISSEIRWTWGGGVLLDDGSVVVTNAAPNGSTDPRRVLRIASDGSMYELPMSGQRACSVNSPLGRMSVIGELGGPSRRSDGSLAITACGRVIGFRLPSPQEEHPFH